MDQATRDVMEFMRAKTERDKAAGRPTGTAAALNEMTERIHNIEEKIRFEISPELTKAARIMESALTQEDADEIFKILSKIEDQLYNITSGRRPEPNRALLELTERVERLEEIIGGGQSARPRNY